MKINNIKSGFTLVEMLLYVAVLAGMSFLLLGFVNNVLKVKFKQQTISEVERQGLSIADHLKRNIEGAESIISPEPGLSSQILSLVLNNNEKIFQIDSLDLNLSLNQEIMTLNNNRVQVANFNCDNLSQNGIKDIIACSYVVSAVDEYNRFEYSYSKSFQVIATNKY